MLILTLTFLLIISLLIYSKYDKLSDIEKNKLPPFETIKTLAFVAMVIALTVYAYFFRLTEKDMSKTEGIIHYIGNCKKIKKESLLPEWLVILERRRKSPEFIQPIEILANHKTISLKINCKDISLKNDSLGKTTSALYLAETRYIYKLYIDNILVISRFNFE